MKIAFLTSSYPRFPGDGTAPFIQSFAQTLAKLGHYVEVVTPYDPLVKDMDTGNVVLHRFKYAPRNDWHTMGHARSLEADAHLRLSAYLMLPFFLCAAFVNLLRVTSRQKTEIVYAHWVIPNGIPAALVAFLRRVPLAVSLHGSDIYLAHKYPLFGLATRWVFHRAAVVTACSPELKQIALELGAPSDTLLLPYGADPVKFNPALRNEEQRRFMKRENGEIIVSSLGRMVPKKGFHIAVEAFGEVKAVCPQARLVLGGEGPSLKELSSQANRLGLKDGVIFPGRISWNEVPVFLASSDIFILPSVRDESGNIDGLPNVLLEAMSCGLPVVASDIGGVGIVVKDKQNGILIPSNDTHALAQALISLINNAPERKRLGNEARQSILTHYNWESIVKILEGRFSGALNRKRESISLDKV